MNKQTDHMTNVRELEQRIAEGKSSPKTIPRYLPANKIKTKPEVFQHRHRGELDESHVSKLARNLRNNPNGEPLAPITVFWTGREWTCIDGHHRLAAYIENIREGHWQGDIPVETFDGDLYAAIGQAGRDNARDKKPLSEKEKSNVAWRLVCLNHQHGKELYSIAKTAAASGVSVRLVSTMRSILKRIEKEYPIHMYPKTWELARMIAEGKSTEDIGFEEILARKAQRLADKLKSKMQQDLTKNPIVTAMALELYAPTLKEQLMKAWSQPADDEEEG